MTTKQVLLRSAVVIAALCVLTVNLSAQEIRWDLVREMRQVDAVFWKTFRFFMAILGGLTISAFSNFRRSDHRVLVIVVAGIIAMGVYLFMDSSRQQTLSEIHQKSWRQPPARRAPDWLPQR